MNLNGVSVNKLIQGASSKNEANKKSKERLESAKERIKKDELLKEAAMALEETESVLKTRKDALFAKHIDGRESY
jgi:hypothetical protein